MKTLIATIITAVIAIPSISYAEDHDFKKEMNFKDDRNLQLIEENHNEDRKRYFNKEKENNKMSKKDIEYQLLIEDMSKLNKVYLQAIILEKKISERKYETLEKSMKKDFNNKEKGHKIDRKRSHNIDDENFDRKGSNNLSDSNKKQDKKGHKIDKEKYNDNSNQKMKFKGNEKPKKFKEVELIGHGIDKNKGDVSKKGEMNRDDKNNHNSRHHDRDLKMSKKIDFFEERLEKLKEKVETVKDGNVKIEMKEKLKMFETFTLEEKEEWVDKHHKKRHKNMEHFKMVCENLKNEKNNTVPTDQELLDKIKNSKRFIESDDEEKTDIINKFEEFKSKSLEEKVNIIEERKDSLKRECEKVDKFERK